MMTENKEQREIVLVVEDNRDVCLVLQTELEDDYEVLIANNGGEGLDMARLHVPDLVLTDIMMPLMSGIDLCRELKENTITNHIPVIMLTAKDQETEQFEGLEVGANDYITKPFSSTLLKMRVHNLLQSRRNYREQMLRQLSKGEALEESLIEDFILKRSTEIVHSHMGDTGFGVEELAQELNLNPRTLQRKLKALINRSPREFIRSIRMNEAHRLLQAGGLSVSEISFRVGYLEPTHFSRSFKQQFGVTPSQLLSRG